MGYFVGLTLLGAALLWALRLIYGRRRAVSDDLVRRALVMGGWILILVGLIGGTGVPGSIILPGPIFVVIILMVVNRFRQSERQALAWVLAMAAERGMPLPETIRAFALECPDELGLRAVRTAELVEAGAALPDALRRSRNRLPFETAAALQFGCQTGCLGPALRRAVKRTDRLDVQLRSIVEKFVYLTVVVFLGIGIVTFMMFKIVPVFDRMFQDFDLALPAPTLLLIDVSRTISQMTVLLVPLSLLLWPLLALALLYYTGYVPIDFPLLGRFTMRLASGTVLRLLALAVREGQSLAQAIDVLAVGFLHAQIRARLWRAGQSIGSGANWCDSLRQVGIVKAGDAAVLKSAERVGNLAWALDEVADSTVRHLGYRVTAVVNLLFPAAVLSLGFCVLFVVVSLFVPLVSMITSLS